VFAVAILLASMFTARAASGPTVTEVLARVGDYVVRYETELSGIVAEEHYSQIGDISDRPQLTRRELKSDLLLVRAEGVDGEGFVQFRDVFEVDGEAVRDRSERLVKLYAVGADGSAELWACDPLVEGALELSNPIFTEGAVYFAARSVSFCTRQLASSPTSSSFSLRQSIEFTRPNSFGSLPALPNLPSTLPWRSTL